MAIDDRWDTPPGYPGPPPGADPDGRWEGGGKWRPPRWVPNTPPPPEDPPEPPEPKPKPEPPPPQYDWMGNQTSRPAPGGFESWDAFNKWRAGLGGYRARPGGAASGKRETGVPKGNRPAGADRVFGRDPSAIQDQLARDRTRAQPWAAPQPGPVADPVPQPMPFPQPPVLPVGPPPPEFQPQPVPVDPRAIMYMQALLQAQQPQPLVQPVNPLQVMLQRLGIGGF